MPSGSALAVGVARSCTRFATCDGQASKRAPWRSSMPHESLAPAGLGDLVDGRPAVPAGFAVAGPELAAPGEQVRSFDAGTGRYRPRGRSAGICAAGRTGRDGPHHGCTPECVIWWTRGAVPGGFTRRRARASAAGVVPEGRDRAARPWLPGTAHCARACAHQVRHLERRDPS